MTATHTAAPYDVQIADGAIHIVTAAPVFEGGQPIRIATMQKLAGFAGDALANAEHLVVCANAYDRLTTALAEIHAACVSPMNPAATCELVCKLAAAAVRTGE